MRFFLYFVLPIVFECIVLDRERGAEAVNYRIAQLLGRQRGSSSEGLENSDDVVAEVVPESDFVIPSENDRGKDKDLARFTSAGENDKYSGKKCECNRRGLLRISNIFTRMFNTYTGYHDCALYDGGDNHVNCAAMPRLKAYPDTAKIIHNPHWLVIDKEVLPGTWLESLEYASTYWKDHHLNADEADALNPMLPPNGCLHSVYFKDFAQTAEKKRDNPRFTDAMWFRDRHCKYVTREFHWFFWCRYHIKNDIMKGEPRVGENGENSFGSLSCLKSEYGLYAAGTILAPYACFSKQTFKFYNRKNQMDENTVKFILGPKGPRQKMVRQEAKDLRFVYRAQCSPEYLEHGKNPDRAALFEVDDKMTGVAIPMTYEPIVVEWSVNMYKEQRMYPTDLWKGKDPFAYGGIGDAWASRAPKKAGEEYDPTVHGLKIRLKGEKPDDTFATDDTNYGNEEGNSPGELAAQDKAPTTPLKLSKTEIRFMRGVSDQQKWQGHIKDPIDNNAQTFLIDNLLGLGLLIDANTEFEICDIDNDKPQECQPDSVPERFKISKMDGDKAFALPRLKSHAEGALVQTAPKAPANPKD